MRARRTRSRTCVASLVLLASTVACSNEARPGVSDSPAGSAPAPDLGELFALERYEDVVAAAPGQLAAARERGAPPAECWEIEHAYLLALAHTGPADRLVERWRTDSVEFADTIPPEFLAELFWHARAVTSDDDRTRLVHATGESFRARWQLHQSLLREARGPYGHPEGFPKAWLAPDERPDDD